jgi:hypothetical protein
LPQADRIEIAAISGVSRDEPRPLARSFGAHDWQG